MYIYINMDISGLPRHKPDNPFNYTEDDLAEKKLAMEKLKIIYPDVSPYYAEMVYDLCKNNAQAKIDEIKKKIESTPFKYDYSNLQEELNKVKEQWEHSQESAPP
jgi:hypothetical protein